MATKGISNRKRLAAVFASLSLFIMGASSLYTSMSLDYYTVLGTLQKVVPASFIMGSLGWVMGMILDKPRKRKKANYNDIGLNNANASIEPSDLGEKNNETTVQETKPAE